MRKFIGAFTIYNFFDKKILYLIKDKNYKERTFLKVFGFYRPCNFSNCKFYENIGNILNIVD